MKIGLPGLVFLLFLYLRLTDKIDWSWAWVTSPLWIPAAIAIPVIIVAAIVVAKQPVKPTRKPPYIR